LRVSIAQRRTEMMSLLDLCAYLGLGAAGAATINLLLGLLIALRYSPVRHWPHRHFNVFKLHQWTAYVAVFFTLTHPLVLLFIQAPHFGIVDLLWPIHSPLQPKLNLAGAGALYLLLAVFISSLLRTRIGRPLWRSLHYLVFPAAVLLLLHSILTDPNLKDGHPDLLDGGKIFVEGAAIVSFLAVAARIALRGRGLRPAKSDVPVGHKRATLTDERS
jgi:predicted ferric reductase